MTKITVYLTQEAQRAAVLAGEPAQAAQHWETTDPALTARALALGAQIDQQGNVTLDNVTHEYMRVLVGRRPTSAADALDALAHAFALAVVEADKRKEEEQAKEAKRCAAWAARPVAERVRHSGGCYYDVNTDGCSVSYLKEYHATALVEAKLEADRLHAEHRARNEAERFAAEQAQAYAAKERAAWIADHGSERLRRALALGLVDRVQDSYLEERLATERPGWRYETGGERRHKAIEPSSEALEALEAARKLYPTCTLVWLRSEDGGCESLADDNFGKGAIMTLGEGNVAAEVETFSSGSLTLDLALGVNGLPRGRLIEIYGPESSGKTTLALHAIAEVQRRGGVCAFIDAEHALDVNYAKDLGVKIAEMLVSQPDCGEQALEIADHLVRCGAVDLVVIDSVAALVPRAEIEGEMGDLDGYLIVRPVEGGRSED